MVLAGHSNKDYINVRKDCGQAGAHTMLSETLPVTNINGPVLRIAQIIKFVMPSTNKAELAGLFVCAKKWYSYARLSWK